MVKLSVFQGNAAHTIEVCSRTLLDTIDHLLYYSKINSFARKGSKSKASGGPQPVAVVDDSGQFGEKSLTCNTQLDRLIEEVIESVFAGYKFQYWSVTQPSTAPAKSINRDAMASHQSNPMQTIFQFNPMPTADVGLSQEFGEVSVILSIDARQNWSYSVQVGAIRRIVMNKFGNPQCAAIHTMPSPLFQLPLRIHQPPVPNHNTGDPASRLHSSAAL